MLADKASDNREVHLSEDNSNRGNLFVKLSPNIEHVEFPALSEYLSREVSLLQNSWNSVVKLLVDTLRVLE